MDVMMENARPEKQSAQRTFVDEKALNELSGKIVDAAIAVHRELGPGLLESVYETCLAQELSGRNIQLQKQVEIPVYYKGGRLEAGFRADILVQDLIIVEIKAVEKLLPIHEAQIITYLRLSGRPLGLLLNFNSKLMKDGIRRFRN
jgi:GxxExxY protein